MKNKKGLIIIMFSFTMITCACSPVTINKTMVPSGPFVLNESTAKYQNMRFYNNITNMFYSLSNDNDNLYLSIKINDEKMQAKIMAAGMEIWIDTTANSTKQTGILFPLANYNKMYLYKTSYIINNESLIQDLKVMKQNFLFEQPFMLLIGFMNTTNGLCSLEDNSGIKVKITWNNTNSMIYEAVIPFNTCYKETDIDGLKTITLTININALTMPQKSQSGRCSKGMPDITPSEFCRMENMCTMFENNIFIEKFRLEVKE